MIKAESPSRDVQVERPDLITQIRDRILSTEDTICLERAELAAEAYTLYADDPPPLKRARTFAHILRHMTLDLDTNPVFAGNTSTAPRAWMLVPEHGFFEPPQIVLENPSLKGLMERGVPQAMRDFWAGKSFGGNAGIGHLAVDYDGVVHKGLNAMIDEVLRRADEGTPDEQIYRRSMSVALQAVVEWAERYAGAADTAAKAASDPVRRACHLRVAEACRHVPGKPARTLFEGLQAIVLTHLAIYIEGHGLSVSIGLPDRILAPFVLDPQAQGGPQPTAPCTKESPDCPTGRLRFSPAQALSGITDLIAAFILKINTNSLFGRGSKTQAITVGGVDYRGEDQCNALTLAFLDAADRVRVGDPHVFLRWHENIAPEIKRRAVEMLAAGVSMPLLIGDTATAQGFINAGVPPEDAWDYCVIGCNELGIPGRSAESATAMSGTIQYLALLNEVLLEHPDVDALDMDALLDTLEATMRERMVQSRLRGQAHRSRIAEQMPTPFTSALMRGCIRRGQDLLVGMDYHLPGVYDRGLTNAVNALAAIQQLVFETGTYRLSDIVQAMRDDFAGHDALLARIRRAPKWGNDDPRADRWADILVVMRERVLDAVDAEYGPGPHMQCHVVRSLHYMDGKRIAASPDGRRAGTPVAPSIGADAGTARAGPTGVLNSVLRLNAAKQYRGGTNLNLTLPSATWNKPEMLDNLHALVETFFAQGGQELQIASLNADVLRDAQAHPERHGDLIVRIAGFNARFVDLAPVEQEEMIRRAEAVG